MSSTFAGLSNASAALTAQRYGLDVTGQNIANASTAGYTRQRAELAAVGPVAGVSSLYSTPAAAGGVTVSGTSRLNDSVIDNRARAEHGRSSNLGATSATLSGVEALFDEPSDTGIGSQLNAFWSSWTAVADNPKDEAARNVVLQKASGLAGSLNATSASLTSLGEGLTGQLTDVTSQINSAAAGVSRLNGAIKVATASGATTNTLADQRDLMLMKLADLAGAQTSTATDGTTTVSIGGKDLVSGTTANVVAGGSGAPLTIGGTALTSAAGGTLQGIVDSLGTVLPAYKAKLDNVASALANSVNALQQSGYDLSGGAGSAVFSGTTAADLKVVVTDPLKLAASGVPGGNLDSSVAGKLALLGAAASGADSQYRQLVSTLGANVQNVAQQSLVQDSVTGSVDALAESASGVSLDEETSNLLTYQRAYQASARVLSTIDEMLDTLISRTGRVGL